MTHSPARACGRSHSVHDLNLNNMLKTLPLLFFLLSVLSTSEGVAQCDNVDFEDASFMGWQAYYGWISEFSGINTPNTGVVNGRHTIISGTGTDPYSCGNIPLVPPGSGTYVVRLGNSNDDAQAERLQYEFNIDSESTLIVYKYAVVLEDPGHTPNEQPRFEAKVFDPSGQVIGCTFYEVAADPNAPGFDVCGNVVYREWTTVGVDMSEYIGQNVTLDLATGDCTQGGHFGYAYVDAFCAPLEIDSRYCVGTDIVEVTLTAPIGFDYVWSTGETTQEIVVTNPAIGQTFSCTITSVTGCQATLNVILEPTSVETVFDVEDYCQNTVTIVSESTADNGFIESFEWLVDGVSDQMGDTFFKTFDTAGSHTITGVATSDAGCIDTLSQIINILPSPDLISDFTHFCAPDSALATADAFIVDNSPLDYLWEWRDANGVVLESDTTTAGLGYVTPGPGSYEFLAQVTSDQGCPDSLVIPIEVGATPNILMTVSDVCVGENVPFDLPLDPGGALVSWWSDGNPVTVENDSLAGISDVWGEVPVEARYTNVYDGFECPASVNETVFVNPFPAVTLSVDDFCSIEPLEPQAVASVPNNVPLLYTWTLFDGAGNITETAGIAQPGPWALANDDYNLLLSVKTGFGCETITNDAFFVGQTPEVDVVLDSVCTGYNIPYELVHDPLGATVTWTADGAPIIPISDSELPSGLSAFPGDPDIQVTYTNNYGSVTCPNSDAQEVIVHYSPDVQLTVDDLCTDAPLEVTVDASIPDDTPLEIRWELLDGAGELINIQNDVTTFGPSFWPNDTYTLSTIVTSEEGCVETVVNPFLVGQTPAVGLELEEVCAGEAIPYNWTDDPLTAQVLWENGGLPFGGATDTELPATLTANAGDIDISLTFTNVYNTGLECPNEVTVTSYVHAVPEAAWIGDTTLCGGDELFMVDETAIQLDTPYFLEWESDLGVSTADNWQQTVDEAGIFPVSLNTWTTFGCGDTTEFYVRVDPLPTLTTVPEEIADCGPYLFDAEALIQDYAGSIQSFQWNNAWTNTESTENTVEYAVYEGDVQLITATVGTGDPWHICYNTAELTAIGYESPDGDFALGPHIVSADFPLVSLYAEIEHPNDPFSWTLDGVEVNDEDLEWQYAFPKHTPGFHEFCFEVVNQYDCRDHVCKVLEIAEVYSHIPNAFTPNNNGLNDAFGPVIYGPTYMVEYSFQVFNRWGDVVFETTDPDELWNGGDTGGTHFVPDDVYSWKLEYLTIFGEKVEKTGNVIILR